MSRKVSLLTMSQGNAIVLKETFKSFSIFCDEIVYADLCLFEEDSKLIESYKNEFNLKIIKLPFNYIFHMGFSNILNLLAKNAKNDLTVYMNCSEVIDIDNGVADIVNSNLEANTFYFDHAVDRHRWFRMNDKRFLSWSGNIHEETVGDARPYHKPIFRMKDLEKDMISSFKAAIFNDVKELVYFNNYLKLVDFPSEKGATNDGWIKFVKDQYDSMKERMVGKGKRYEAFMNGDLDMYIKDVYSNKQFEKERFESSDIINFQGARKIVL